MLELGAGGEILPLNKEVIDIMKKIVDDYHESGEDKKAKTIKTGDPHQPETLDWGKRADAVEEAIMNFIGIKRSKKMTNDEMIFYIFLKTAAVLNCPGPSKTKNLPLENSPRYMVGECLMSMAQLVLKADPEHLIWDDFEKTMADEKLNKAIKQYVRERLKSKVSETSIWFQLWMIIRNSFDYRDTLLHCCSQKPIKEATLDDIERLKESLKK